VRILHTSDWHGDAVTAGMRRIDDLEAAVQRTVDIAVERKCDAYVFHGDLADPDCGSILVRVLDMALAAAANLTRLGIPRYWIARNHDVIEGGSGVSTLRPLRTIDGVTLIEWPAMIELFDDVSAIFLPFVSRAKLYDPAEEMRQLGARWITKHRAVFGHCTGLDGVIMGSESRDMSRGAELPFPLEECKRQNVALMANGHWHRQQRTPGGVYIPGSLERLRFDEEDHTPGILISEIG